MTLTSLKDEGYEVVYIGIGKWVKMFTLKWMDGWMPYANGPYLSDQVFHRPTDTRCLMG